MVWGRENERKRFREHDKRLVPSTHPPLPFVIVFIYNSVSGGKSLTQKLQIGKVRERNFVQERGRT